MKTVVGLSWLSALSSLAMLPNGSGVVAQNNTPSAWPIQDNGLNDVVQWDHYSFKVNGKRLFVFSGEIHYWRIPVYEVWEDLLEKIKAAGKYCYSDKAQFCQLIRCRFYCLRFLRKLGIPQRKQPDRGL